MNPLPQDPDTHLPICLSAGRVSATLYMQSLDDSLSQTSQVIRRRSVNLTAMMPRPRLEDSLLRFAEGYAMSVE